MEYTVIKQKRKTATIVITQEQEVQVKVPKFMTKKQIDWLVRQHEEWILKTLEKKKELSETKDWYKTHKILYLGKYWPVTMIEDPIKAPKADFNGEAFIVISDGSEKGARDSIEKFYRLKAKELLVPLAEKYAKIVGVSFQKMTIRNQKTRWGSCSSKGNLSFNLKILCAPTEMMEYVVLHEIMHIRHFDHSKEFWKDIEDLMPDYKRRMNYFKQYGQNFMI